MKTYLVRFPGSAAVVAMLLLLAFLQAAYASRVDMPMGYYIRSAETIVIGDTGPGGALETSVLVREVLKGDGTLVGQTITLDLRSGLSTASAIVPGKAQGIGVLLEPGWKTAKTWPVRECYLEADEVKALRILTKLCAIEDERPRLLAVRGTLALGNRICEKEFFAQLGDMRAAENFDILTEAYPDLGPDKQYDLLRLIGEIGDLRGVPVLIAALDSSDQKVSQRAAYLLSDVFPGAPGVTKALEAAFEREHLKTIAARYLARYSPDPKYAALAEAKSTAWMRAAAFLKSGKKAESRAVFFEILKDPATALWTRLNAVSELMKEASPSDKDQIRVALLAALVREPFADDYLQAKEVAALLRSLRSPDCLDAFLPILRPDSFLYTESAWTAVMAIRELGAEARAQASAQILKQLSAPPPKTPFSGNFLRYPLELVWLGTRKNFEEAGRSMHAQYQAAWESVRPLMALADEVDEFSLLLGVLRQRADLPDEVVEWVLLRLGDLKDKRAIEELVACVAGTPDWNWRQKAADALVAIGGPEAEAGLVKLLRHADENGVRRHATEALFRLLGKRSGELARRIITEADFGWKPAAYTALGAAGTEEDLKLLASLSDFWTGDRANHYWAMSAFRAVRGRCNYDVNGPVREAP